MATKQFKVVFAGDAAGATHAIDQVEGRSSGLGKKIGGIGTAVAGAFAVGKIVEFGKSASAAASNLAEAQGKNAVVFGQFASQVERFAGTTTKAFGISKREALDSAAGFGTLFTSLGLGQGVASDMSMKMVALAGDMASFSNVPVTDALDAMRSAMVGETEPIRRLGVSMDDATLRAQALKLGLVANTKEALSPAVKAQAAYSLILEKTSVQQGDAARSADRAAQKQKVLAAQTEDLKAKFATGLQPAVAAVLGAFTGLMNVLGRLSPGTQQFLLVVAGLAGTVFLIVKATQAWTAAQTAFNVIMAANPVVLVVAAIVALVAAVVIAWNKFEGFRDFVKGALHAVGATFEWLGGFFVAVYNGGIRPVFNLIGAAIGHIADAFGSIGNAVSSAFGFAEGVARRVVGVMIWLINKVITGINAVIQGWNNANLGLNFLDISKIPHIEVPGLAGGGTVRMSGMALVGEQGPELLHLPRGAAVAPLPHAGAASGDLHIHVDVDGREIARAVVRPVRDELVQFGVGRRLGLT